MTRRPIWLAVLAAALAFVTGVSAQRPTSQRGDIGPEDVRRVSDWLKGLQGGGSGIDPAVMDKIFDPFFTTKDVGQGMGLGLSICYRIVQGYDGRISVKSEPGKFCEFTLEFPVKGET